MSLDPEEVYIPDFGLEEFPQRLVILDFRKKRLESGAGKAKFQPWGDEWKTARLAMAEIPDNDRCLGWRWSCSRRLH